MGTSAVHVREGRGDLVHGAERGHHDPGEDKHRDHRYEATPLSGFDRTADEASTAECLQVLMKILAVREEKLGAEHTATGESYHILGLLYRYMKNYYKAKEATETSLQVFKNAVGEDHPSTQLVKSSLAVFEELEL